MDFLLILIALIYWVARSASKRSAAQKQKEAARARAQAAFSEDTSDRQMPLTQEGTEQQAPAAHAKPHLTTPYQRRHPLASSRATGHAHMETSLTGTTDTCPPVIPDAPFETVPLADRLAAYKAEKRRTEHSVFSNDEAPPQVIDLAASSENTFQFDPARVREGLIYAEILGKPKALRR